MIKLGKELKLYLPLKQIELKCVNMKPNCSSREVHVYTGVTFLAASIWPVRAVAPAVAKLSPCLVSALRSLYGGTNGRPDDTATNSFKNKTVTPSSLFSRGKKFEVKLF